MVFCRLRIVSWNERKYAANTVWFVLLQYLQSGIVGTGVYRRRKYPKIKNTVPSFFDAGRFMARSFLEDKKRFDASFTIEAMLVLSIVFFTLASMLQKAYVVHDQVTGTMILEETVERIRYGREEKNAEILKEGERLGNPRLWLGRYELQIEGNKDKIEGRASAGKWSKEIEMKKFWPEQLIRRYRALMEIGEWAEKDGS